MTIRFKRSECKLRRFPDGKTQITGMASTEEAQNLASYIRIGSLSLELTELRSSVVAAQLGEEAIATSVKAGAIGLVIVMLIMIIAYRIPGLVASIALVLYTTLMLITLNAFDITLTLPGIAGIILSVGMGVDANIITGERIREELRKGKTLDTALYSGYHRAFSAILDGNLTGILVSIVLMGAFGVPDSIWAKIFNHTIFWFFGATTEGVIYSFGFTLMTGLIMNFIMGVFAARTDDHVSVSVQVLPEQETLWRWYQCQSRLRTQSILM